MNRRRPLWTAMPSSASRRGTMLILVTSISFILLITVLGLSTYVVDINRLTRVKWQNDQAEYVASAGLAHMFAVLQSLPNAPNLNSRVEVTDSGRRVAVPEGASYRMFASPVNPPTPGIPHYLLECVASYTDPKLNKPIFCKAEVEVVQESFAKYEQFVDFADAWDSPYLKEYQDFGTIALGPIHSNSGCNIFSSCLFAKPFTSGAPEGAKFFNNLWDMYYWVRNNDGRNPDSQDSVNVAGPQADLGYPYETVFYGGLSVGEDSISLPGVGNTQDYRTRALRENAQLKLPQMDTGVETPRPQPYPEGSGGKYMYVIEFDGGHINTTNDGQVTVKQYLGWQGGNPRSENYKRSEYRTVGTWPLGETGKAILVRGDIIGLRGTIDGRVTVAAMNNPDGGGGDVYITDELIYESRHEYRGPQNELFEYPDRDRLTAGGQLNEAYYSDLQTQVEQLDDVLGIVADGSVLIPEGAETGGAAAFRSNDNNTNQLKRRPRFDDFKNGSVRDLVTNGNKNHPENTPSGGHRFHVDGIVMSTAYNGADSSFGAVNALYRDHGWIHTLGGIISLRTGQWNLFTGNTWTGGIQRYKYWDMRMSDPVQAPPYFPLTGEWTVVDDTWKMNYVSSGSG